MLFDIFPLNLVGKIKKIFSYDLTEIRLKVDMPIIVYKGVIPYFLGESGLLNSAEGAIFTSKEDIENIVFRASNCSIYSINERLKKGFISLSDGCRIGVCGDVIYENNEIKTITNFYSLNIRISHQVKNCSLKIYRNLLDEGNIHNTLIISPPGAGKTTFLRDIVYQLSNNSLPLKVCIIDERGEIATRGMDVGIFADIITFSTKKHGFEQAIRTMSPNVIVTDELGNEEDVDALLKCFNSGVRVIASIHAKNIEEVRKKSFMKPLFEDRYFSRYVVLSCNNSPGEIEGVYNNAFSRIGFLGVI